MNQKLVQINNNYGIVSDENGDISFIEKENDSYNFEEILLKENNLEDLRSKLSELKNYKNKIPPNKGKMTFSEIAGIITTAISIIGFVFLYLIAPLKFVVILFALVYIPLKVAGILKYLTRFGYIKEKEKIDCDIEKLESEILTLERELTEIKEKSKYRTVASTVNETNPLAKEIYNENPLSYSKVKVLSLTKKK